MLNLFTCSTGKQGTNEIVITCKNLKVEIGIN